MKKIFKLAEDYGLHLGTLILLLYLSPLVLFGENSLIPVLDNLDHMHSLYKVLAENGHIFASNHTQIPNILNGVPRLSFGTEFNVYLWFFYFFGPFNAYVLNMFCIHFVAFFGMFKLLTNHFMPQAQKLVVVGIATTFGLLPFHDFTGLSVAGQALVLNNFLNIRKGSSNWSDWLILLLMPLYSSFILVFVFFLFFMGLIWLYDLIIQGKQQIKFGLAVVLMTLVYLGVEYRLIHAMFFDETFISVRTEFRPQSITASFLFTLHKALMSGVTYFSWSSYYAKSLQTFFIIPAAIIGVFLILDRNLEDKTLIKLILFTAFLSFSHAFIKVFWSWDGMQSFIEQYSILSTFRFYRFNYMYPLLWYLIFGLSLNLILIHSKSGTYITCVLLALQICYGFYYHDEIQKRNKKTTYQEFFAKEQFSDIEKFIAKNKTEYKVVSIGIYPSIALYNGFHTLDGYMTNYPLKHKHDFRKIIKNELDKNLKNKNYYDAFGGRCYVFVNDLHYDDWNYRKERKAVINNLEFNTEAFKKLGGDYILSAVKINNFKENKLELLKIFENDLSAWRIFLYRPIN